jgi:hypothetical protein
MTLAQGWAHRVLSYANLAQLAGGRSKPPAEHSECAADFVVTNRPRSAQMLARSFQPVESASRVRFLGLAQSIQAKPSRRASPCACRGIRQSRGQRSRQPTSPMWKAQGRPRRSRGWRIPPWRRTASAEMATAPLSPRPPATPGSTVAVPVADHSTPSSYKNIRRLLLRS